MALCAVMLLLFSLLSLAPAQDGMPGGWHPIDAKGEEAQRVAKVAFGIWVRRQPPGLRYKLGEVVTAKEQVVFGSMYELQVLVKTSVPGPADQELGGHDMLCVFSLHMPPGHRGPSDVDDKCVVKEDESFAEY